MSAFPPPRTRRQPSCDISRRSFLKAAGALALLLGIGGPFTRRMRAATPVIGDAAQYHLLNRISYAVRTADLQRIARLGIPAYLEEQFRLTSKKVVVATLWKVSRAKIQRMKNPHTYQALIGAVVKRATASPAQLYERMVEFWSDHFNIASEGLETEVLDYQRAVIRKLAFGKFRDLLFATAKHPAMLYYLDNYLNVAEHPNENYARELMELHTIGVDGGYTETDVKELARALTGWTADYTSRAEGFHFDADNHDTGAKTVLGLTLAAGRGIEDGNDVLTMLANSEKTARFLCRKLAIRFVADSPPQSLVDKMVAAWMGNDTAIVPVLRTMFLSDEFNASAGQKLRRPLDYFLGALRVSGTRFTDFWWQGYVMESLGQVPYGWSPPNGYPEPASAWANTNGLLERWNTATAVTDWALDAGPRDGIKTTLSSIIGRTRTVGELVDRCADRLLALVLDDTWRARLVDFVSDGAGESAPVTRDLRESKLGPLCGLLLSSPLFQWR